MSVRDRWHLSRPPAGAVKCGKHRKYPSAEHGQGKQWQVEGKDDRQKTIRRNFDIEQDAKDFDAELKTLVRSGRWVDERAGKVTLRSRCELWMTTRGHDPTTAERVETEFRCHVYDDPENPGTTTRGGLAIGGMSIGLLARQPTTLGAWLTRLPLHHNSKTLLYDLLASVFDDAVHDHIIAESPFGTAIKRLKRISTEVVAWPAEQLAEVAGNLPAYAEAMPLLAGTCGHRQGELFAVAKPDIDWRHKNVRVQVQLKMVGNRLVFAPIKNDRARTVPLTGYVHDMLSAHMAMFPPVEVTLPWSDPKDRKRHGQPVTRELIFTRADGQPWTRGAFNPYWRRAWRAAGIEEAEQVNGIHVARHSAAAAWLSGGLNVAKVATYLGDSVAVVSKTYAHFLPADEDRARVIMEAHVKPLAGRQTSRVASSEVREVRLCRSWPGHTS